jgi:hypothetical protein
VLRVGGGVGFGELGVRVVHSGLGFGVGAGGVGLGVGPASKQASKPAIQRASKPTGLWLASQPAS